MPRSQYPAGVRAENPVSGGGSAQKSKAPGGGMQSMGPKSKNSKVLRYPKSLIFIRNHWEFQSGRIFPQAVKKSVGTNVPAGTRGPERVSPLERATGCYRSPGKPWAQYIRSGPEGARGVLKGRGWSLSVCVLLMYCRPFCSSYRSPGGAGLRGVFAGWSL